MKIVRAFIDTPVGVMRALASESALCAFEFFDGKRMASLDARLARWFEAVEIEEGTNDVIEQMRRRLDGYFAGAHADFSAVPLDLRGARFERAVWDALKQIPPGTTTTYGAIAKQVGSPGAARAVGRANGANPVAIIVPCHRVIGGSGALIGYGGGFERKEWLLDHERRWARCAPGRLFAS
jgi:AraC family transcriptional regulator of adaptative response/methylated-DNA-[protein]-cysteine methyltransferase